MPKRCVLGNCSRDTNHTTIHEWPKDEITARKWDKFVKMNSVRKDLSHKSHHATSIYRPTARSTLCGLHFLPEDFHGYTEYKMGFKDRLDLKKHAVPSQNVPYIVITSPQNPLLEEDGK